MLLDALRMYDERASEEWIETAATATNPFSERASSNATSSAHSKRLPDLLVLVTGKGPQRAAYAREMASLRLRRVAARTAWVESSEYPKLLGSADLGVCLHTSSSGLDLPMKVVDMFGCGLPVVAVRYDAIGELVVADEARQVQGAEERRVGKTNEFPENANRASPPNGALFSDAGELCATLTRLLRGWGEGEIELDVLRAGAAEAANTRWAEHWEEHALPVFQE
jgi:beta-1,4-mannosyltransferase